MGRHDGSQDARTIRSEDGTWVFVSQEPLRFGDRHAWSTLVMVRTPTGRILDLYLPLGTEAAEVSDAELLQRARKVQIRTF